MSDNTYDNLCQLKLNDINYHINYHEEFDASFSTKFDILLLFIKYIILLLICITAGD